MNVMDYWQLRESVKRIIPRRSALADLKKATSLVNEKGRKKNYQQFSIVTSDMEQKLRLLKKDQINSFLEISLRASACPMPFNMDVWDRSSSSEIAGCPYACRYCVKGDTEIQTPNGTKQIKDLKKGDEVCTFNEETKQIENKIITDTMNRRSKIFKLKVGDNEIYITSEHPVYTEEGWKKVGELKIGEKILTVKNNSRR